ncbi:hypothetical protein HDV03_005521 [Kappamyces sp. JEL0829]|nr:hypothetical protein HDV03_005521 [Kappamyces sp. JEL0829]
MTPIEMTKTASKQTKRSSVVSTASVMMKTDAEFYSTPYGAMNNFRGASSSNMNVI